MRLTNFSDLSFRVLIFAAAKQDRLFTLDEMNLFYDVSRGHLMKVVNTLVREGFLVSVRGRSGGLRLAHPPEEINLSTVLKATESDFSLVECMRDDNKCALSAGCRLYDRLDEAMTAFLQVLGKYTLADIALNDSIFLNPAVSDSQ